MRVSLPSAFSRSYSSSQSQPRSSPKTVLRQAPRSCRWLGADSLPVTCIFINISHDKMIVVEEEIAYHLHLHSPHLNLRQAGGENPSLAASQSAPWAPLAVPCQTSTVSLFSGLFSSLRSLLSLNSDFRFSIRRFPGSIPSVVPPQRNQLLY